MNNPNYFSTYMSINGFTNKTANQQSIKTTNPILIFQKLVNLIPRNQIFIPYKSKQNKKKRNEYSTNYIITSSAVAPNISWGVISIPFGRDILKP